MTTSHRSATAFAVVYDIAASWHDYRRVAVAVNDTAVPGLILHAAGPTDDGFRTIDVWDDKETWQRHRDRWLAAFDDLSTPPVARELDVQHLAGVVADLAAPTENGEQQ